MTPMQFQQLQQSAGLAVKQSREALAAVQNMGGENAAIRQEMQRMAQNAQQLQQALSRVEVSTRVGDPSIQRIENIPGRRIPFDLLVDIPVPANSTQVQQGTITISQEGPFVAVARCATLLSAYEFQVIEPGEAQSATFQGRSFGRYRPIHSAWDLNDGQPRTQVFQGGLVFPGTGAPYIASPSNSSSFRTMEGDFRIDFRNAGSSFPRQNLEVPSTFWTKAINEPWDLGALDFFERGEVLQFNVLPLHANNPAFGNISSFAGANSEYPFIDSQYDAVEGIDDQIQQLQEDDPDPVTRLPNAILTIGFSGYRIVQPAGAGPY